MADLRDTAEAKAGLQEAKKSKIKIVVIALVVCVALAASGYFVMSRRAIAGGKKPANARAQVKPQAVTPVAQLSLATFVVNLADPDRNSFLRVDLTLGLNAVLPKDGGDAKDSPLIPEVRDTILSVLTTWQSSQLLAPGGKAKLKEEILSALQRQVPQLGAANIYFTDFLIQQ